MKYSMVFAFTPGLQELLLLKKPDTHHNELFRGNWTVPGGHIKPGESIINGAAREFTEETALLVATAQMRYVLSFACNCDPTEAEHEVIVYGVELPREYLRTARGTIEEPVLLFGVPLPNNLLWYIHPLRDMAISRLRQPVKSIRPK